MPNKRKDVQLIPSEVAASGWKVKHDGKEGEKPGQGPNAYPVVEVNQPGPHLVVFTLPPDNPQKPGEHIVFNEAEPMQIRPGTGSPTQKGMDGEFEAAIFDGGKTLVVLDSNTKAGDYSYRVKADGYEPILDPIIKNGGGTYAGTATATQQQPSYSMTEVGIAVLVAFLAGLLVHRLLFARPKTTG